MTQNLQTPALRQSVYEDMACPHLYGAKHVAKIVTPGGPAASRGIEIHAVFATYISHLVKARRRRTDGGSEPGCQSGPRAFQIQS